MNGRLSYGQQFPNTSQAAEVILPHFFEVAGDFDTALDVGGGTGAWCVVLKNLGITWVRCVDHPGVVTELQIQPDEFVACDMTIEFPTVRRFDLVLCLEFAEHLPMSRSHSLIDFLTASGDVILFSAAVPGQPSPYHANPQPAEYWRNLFAERGFVRFDCMRPRIISNTQIPYWYRQNMFVYATEPAAQRRRLRSLPFTEIPHDFEIIHDRVLNEYRTIQPAHQSASPGIVWRSIKARLNPRW